MGEWGEMHVELTWRQDGMECYRLKYSIFNHARKAINTRGTILGHKVFTASRSFVYTERWLGMELHTSSLSIIDNYALGKVKILRDNI